jgi:hypothetical protein
MKRLLFISLISLSSILTVEAQWVGTSTNANVAIGTDPTTSPLTIKKASQHLIPSLDIFHIPANPGCNGCYNIGQRILVSDDQGTNKRNIGLWINALNARYNYAAIFENGNVGIGTTSPHEKLEIKKGNLRFNGGTASAYGSLGKMDFYNNYSSSNVVAERIEGKRDEYSHKDGRLSFYTANTNGVLNENLTLNRNGNLGIGTTTPYYKLDVCGTIRAKAVKVDLLGGCDFVFKKDYQLMDLTTLEKFVKTNQHLPEIASEKEMVENGVDLKNLQMKLLQKIEELTLYVIDINKEVKDLRQENKQLKEEIIQLKEE